MAGPKNRKWMGPDSPELMNALINSVPRLLIGCTMWEDHHAVAHLMDTMDCSRDLAMRILSGAIRKFPGLKVYDTGLNLGQ